jgi:hypothetical protein
MATLCFFEETIHDQGGKESMMLEIGRSSFYDEDSLYIRVDDKTIIVDRTTATKIWEAVDGVAGYLSLRT